MWHAYNVQIDAVVQSAVCGCGYAATIHHIFMVPPMF